MPAFEANERQGTQVLWVAQVGAIFNISGHRLHNFSVITIPAHNDQTFRHWQNLRHQKMFEQRVPEEKYPHVARPLRAPAPQQAMPVMGIPLREQRTVTQHDQCARFIKMSQGVLRT